VVSQLCGVCRDSRASHSAGLFPSTCVPTSDRMEIKPQWVPDPDIRVVDAKLLQNRWIVKAIASVEAKCPGCGIRSQRRHSAYVRRLQDLPVQGTAVELQVSVTRWRCGNRLWMLVGRPLYLPAAFAMPSRWRSSMISRSHVATPVKMVGMRASLSGRVTVSTSPSRTKAPAWRRY
jgi:hypothetical protein